MRRKRILAAALTAIFAIFSAGAGPAACASASAGSAAAAPDSRAVTFESEITDGSGETSVSIICPDVSGIYRQGATFVFIDGDDVTLSAEIVADAGDENTMTDAVTHMISREDEQYHPEGGTDWTRGSDENAAWAYAGIATASGYENYTTWVIAKAAGGDSHAEITIDLYGDTGSALARETVCGNGVPADAYEASLPERGENGEADGYEEEAGGVSGAEDAENGGEIWSIPEAAENGFGSLGESESSAESAAESVAEEPESAAESVAEEPESEAESVAEEPESAAESVAEEPESEAESVAEEPESEAESLAEEPESSTESAAENPESVSEEDIKGTLVAADFGTYLVPEGWERYAESDDSKPFYVSRAWDGTGTPDNISVEYGNCPYHADESVEFGEAIEEQLREQVPEAIITGKSTANESGILILTFVIDSGEGITTQYYALGDECYVLIHETNFSGSADCDRAAETIVSTLEMSVAE